VNKFPFRRGLAALLAALLLAACQASAPAGPAGPDSGASFFNPLNPLDGPDPWLQYYDGNYYLTATQGSAIRMWKSPTLGGLATAKANTLWVDTDRSRCCNLWAPEFHLLDGPNGKRWYIYYSAGTDGTLDNQRTHVLESAGTDPLGPYTYKARIFDKTHDGWAIDGSILTMPEHKLYFLFSSWTISGSRVLISSATYPWEKSLANVNEGPAALQHDGKTFIVYSASACWGPDYKLGMLTYSGGDPLDPKAWVKSPEPVFQRSDANGVYGPGHNGFFSSPDGKESWIVYHANADPSDGCSPERTTRVQKFTWNADGTPNFGEPLALETPIAPPSGEQAVAATSSPVLYQLVSKGSGQCLAAGAQQAACGDSPEQRWSFDYLGNNYYRLLNKGSGQALELTGEGSAAKIQPAAWSHSLGQQWKVGSTGDGWVKLEAREGESVLGLAGCEAGSSAGAQAGAWQKGNDCQQFRLQPVGDVKLVNANTGKVVSTDRGGIADGVNVVLWSLGELPGQRWSFVHKDNGYYQLVASPSADSCLAVVGDPAANGANVALQTCADAAGQQWRFDMLGDGMLRLVSRPSGKVLDVKDCRMADGTDIHQWIWLNNMCQRYHFAAP
jgi:GH43 family beta-xylosidase